MEIFTDKGKLKKFLWQLEMFNVYTTGDTANIDKKRVWQQLEYRIDVCRVTRGAHFEHI
jgi:lipoate-protein ligase B